MSTSHHASPSDTPASVRTLDSACLQCHRAFQLNPCHLKNHSFCSAPCRAKWHREHPRQLTLPADPPVNPVQRLGPTPEQIRAAQKPQSVKVLRMLQEAGVMGCTTGDFLRAGIGRFSARLLELRQVGHVITTDKLTDSSALFILEEP